jgi:hypothetical protein
MRAWLLQGEPGGETDALACALRQWAGRPENSSWTIDCLRWAPDVVAVVRARLPDVLFVAGSSFPAGAWIGELLGDDVGLVVGTSLERAGAYASLAETHAVHLMPLPASAEGIGLAVLNVLTGLYRQRAWKSRIDQLQQRLNDRIVIERAKGVLVQRLGISEKEAYQRLRVQSRRQRRQIRDVAQSLLDSQTLLLPEMNGYGGSPGLRLPSSPRDGQSAQVSGLARSDRQERSEGPP